MADRTYKKKSDFSIDSYKQGDLVPNLNGEVYTFEEKLNERTALIRSESGQWIVAQGIDMYELNDTLDINIRSFGYPFTFHFSEGIEWEHGRYLGWDSTAIDFNAIREEFSKKPKHRLYVDMDGTLAEFREVNHLEALYEQGYFLHLAPFPNVINAVKDIVTNDSDIEVFVLSAYLSDSAYALDEKNAWLDRYIPEIDTEHRVFVPCGTDKKEAIADLSDNDYLLDDYTTNLLEWNPPGSAIKLVNDINHKNGVWKQDSIRYDRSRQDLCDKITSVIKNKEVHIYDKSVFDMSDSAMENAYNMLRDGISSQEDDNDTIWYATKLWAKLDEEHIAMLYPDVATQFGERFNKESGIYEIALPSGMNIPRPRDEVMQNIRYAEHEEHPTI